MTIGQYDIGDKVRLSVTITDTAGALADPGALSLKYQKPNAGTTTTLVYGADAALVRDSLGHYHADIAVDQAGDWHYRFVATGNAAGAERGFFNVRADDLAA